MSEEHDLAPLVGQCRECGPDCLGPIHVGAGSEVRIDQCLGRRAPIRSQVIDRDVPSESKQPGEERRATIVLLDDCRYQLGEYVLRHVLGLVTVADGRADVAVHVVRVTDIQVGQRGLIAFLGLCDGEADLVPRFGRLVERGPGPEADRPSRCRNCFAVTLFPSIEDGLLANPSIGPDSAFP